MSIVRQLEKLKEKQERKLGETAERRENECFGTNTPLDSDNHTDVVLIQETTKDPVQSVTQSETSLGFVDFESV